MAKIETVETGKGEIGNTKSPLPKKANKQSNQLKNWCFTYNNYKETDILLIVNRFKEICTKYVFQKEIGIENKTPHLQGAIWLKRSMRYSEFKLPKAIHWEKMNNEEASTNYCQKRETGLGEIYQMGFPKPIKIIQNLYPWQTKIEQLINTEPDDRKIHWFWEKKGHTGKSAFVKYLLTKYLPLGKMCFLDGDKKSDLINRVYNTDMNTCDTILYDLSRSTGGCICYDTLESLKNGIICNTKYETGYKIFNSPHIIIFANEPPTEPWRMSKDRWVIERLNTDIESSDEEDEEDEKSFCIFYN